MYVLCSIPYYVAHPIRFHPLSTSFFPPSFCICALWWDMLPDNTNTTEKYMMYGMNGPVTVCSRNMWIQILMLLDALLARQNMEQNHIHPVF